MKRRGFTLVEVALVIAISALLFVAFIASVAGSLASRRYTDSVQNFAEFLRTQYERVINVQSGGTGNTTQAIYGRLITFGENGNTVYAYDIVGQAVEADTVDESTLLFGSHIKGNALRKPGATCEAINQTAYDLKNEAWVEKIDKTKFTGTIFIIRSPANGSVITAFYDSATNLNMLIGTACSIDGVRSTLSTNYSHSSVATDVNFCVASEDLAQDVPRRLIKLRAGGNSSSAVQVIAQDSEDNLCNN